MSVPSPQLKIHHSSFYKKSIIFFIIGYSLASLYIIFLETEFANACVCVYMAFAAASAKRRVRGVRGSVGTGGTGRVADRRAWHFPFETMYTLQKSGAHFNTVPGVSEALNSLQKEDL